MTRGLLLPQSGITLKSKQYRPSSGILILSKKNSHSKSIYPASLPNWQSLAYLQFNILLLICDLREEVLETLYNYSIRIAEIQEYMKYRSQSLKKISRNEPYLIYGGREHKNLAYNIFQPLYPIQTCFSKIIGATSAKVESRYRSPSGIRYQSPNSPFLVPSTLHLGSSYSKLRDLHHC